MKISEYNDMMAYLTRPPRSEQQEASGERVQLAAGGLLKVLKKVFPKRDLSEYADLIEQARKAGVPINTIKDLENFQKQVQEASGKIYESRKKYPGVEGEKSGLPIDENELSTEQLIEYRKDNRAGKGRFTNAEAIIARLENTIKGMDPDDEDYEYVTKTFPNFIKELKANPKLAENENVWNNLMSELPEDQRFIKYDDGTVDFETKRPSHQFKLREDLDTDRLGIKTDRTLNAKGGQVGKNRPTQEQLNKTIKEIQNFVADKKSKGEQIFHKDLEKITGGKNVYLLKKAGVMDDITRLAQEGRGPVQQKVQSIINEKIDEFYEGNRPISELKPETLNKEIAEEVGLEKIGKRNFSTYLNANEKYKEMIPVRNSIDQSIKKQKGPVKEKLQTLTFEEAKGGDVVAKARPDLPQPKGVEDSILRDLRRYAVQNKNKGSLFQIAEDSKDYNKLKILDAETGEILDKNKIKKYIKQGDPRFKEYVDTFKDVRKIKNKKYDGTTLNEALKKIKRGGVDASVQLGHVDGVGVNPLKNLEPQLAFANQAARAKGVDFKKLGLQAPGGEGIPRKLTAEENINRFVKFADRSLKAEKGLGTKLYSGFSPELGKLSYEVLKDVAKGIPTFAGATALTAATGGIDPTSAIDRTALGAELAFAPELARQSAKFGPTTQRILNLGLSPKMAMRAARFASPVGIATLGAEGAYQLYQALENEKARIAAMSPEERQQFEEEQTAAAYMGEAEGFANGGRVEMRKGGNPKDKPIIPINPNAPEDPGRRTFMEGVGMGGLGIAGLATGLIKFAPEIKKAVTGITTQMSEVPNIVKELYTTIKSLGTMKKDIYPKSLGSKFSDRVKYEYGPYRMEEGPDGFNITKHTTSDYRYQEEYFGVTKNPETGAIEYEELTVLPDMDGKLKDVDYGIDLGTYREIGEDLAKIRKDDNLIKIANDDIDKIVEKEEAYKKSLGKKGTGEND